MNFSIEKMGVLFFPTFQLLWDVLSTERFQTNYQDFLEEIVKTLEGYGLIDYEINTLVRRMKGTYSLAEAKALPRFQLLLKRPYLPIPANLHEEIAQLLFNYAKLLLANVKADPRGAVPQELYQSVRREKYEYFKMRIAEDESRLLNDIAILRAIADPDETL